MPDERLGVWTPATIDGRLDRMESYAAIQQLVSRYARALDARDMDTWCRTFIRMCRSVLMREVATH